MMFIKTTWRKFKRICDDIELAVECGQQQGKESALKGMGVKNAKKKAKKEKKKIK